MLFFCDSLRSVAVADADELAVEVFAGAAKIRATGAVAGGALNDTAGAVGATAGVDGAANADCANMLFGAGAFGVASSSGSADGFWDRDCAGVAAEPDEKSGRAVEAGAGVLLNSDAFGVSAG